MDRRSFAWAGLLLLLSLWFPSAALAHPEILATFPAMDAELRTPPTELRVIFNEPIEASFSALQLFTAQGQRVDQGGGGRSAADPAVLELTALPVLGPGLYTAVWQVIGSDGHAVKSHFSFTVLDLSPPQPTPSAAPGATAAPPPAPTPLAPVVVPELELPQPVSQPPASAGPILRTLMLLGAIGAFGSALSLLMLWPALPLDQPAAADQLRTRWQTSAWLFLGMLLIGAVNFIFVNTIAVTGSALNLANIGQLLFHTVLGNALLIRLALALALAALAATQRPFVRWRTGLALALGGLLLLTFSASGHAAAAAQPILAITLDWLHLAAVAAWVGGLFVLAFALPAMLASMPVAERAAPLAAIIRRFSALALASVSVLTISGTLVALARLNQPADLWTSGYGRALSFKLVMFGGLIAFGAYNMLVVGKRFSAWTAQVAAALTQGRWQRRFHWSVRGEVLLAVLALGAAGVLTSTSPPQSAAGAPQVTPAPTATAAAPPTTPPTAAAPPTPIATPTALPPFVQRQTVADLQIELRVDPARVGPNQLTVTLSDATGVPYAAQQVAVQLTLPAIDLGETRQQLTEAGAGRYTGETALTIAGEWTMTVEIFRRETADAKVTFRVPVQQ